MAFNNLQGFQPNKCLLSLIVKYLTIKNHSPFLLKANYLKLFSYPELRLESIDYNQKTGSIEYCLHLRASLKTRFKFFHFLVYQICSLQS